MYWGLNMYYNTLEKILSSHPPRSLIASSNLFSFMAVCTNLVCKLWNKQQKKKKRSNLSLFCEYFVSIKINYRREESHSPSPHTPLEANEQPYCLTGRWHRLECQERPPSGLSPPPHPTYCSGNTRAFKYRGYGYRKILPPTH